MNLVPSAGNMYLLPSAGKNVPVDKFEKTCNITGAKRGKTGSLCLAQKNAPALAESRFVFKLLLID